MIFFLRHPDSDRTLWLDQERQQLFVVVQGQQFLVGEEGGSLAVLPFLELSVIEVARRASDFGPEFNFPYGSFVEAGFTHGSDYWTKNALNWLLGLESVFSIGFLEAIEKVMADKAQYRQDTRHLAKKVLAQATSRSS